MKTYTVIGIYKDNGQRYAESFVAKDAEAAEMRAVKVVEKNGGGHLTVAGVILGDVQVVA